MATVTLSGSLRTFGGANFNHLDPVIIFRPSGASFNQSNIFSGPDVRVSTFDSGGGFSVELERTDTMLTAGAHYKVLIEWRSPGITGDTGAGVALHDTGWKVTATKNGAIGDNATPPSANQLIWWVSLTPPQNRGFIWNYLDPTNPDRETGPIPGLVLGDILTRWW